MSKFRFLLTFLISISIAYSSFAQTYLPSFIPASKDPNYIWAQRVVISSDLNPVDFIRDANKEYDRKNENILDQLLAQISAGKMKAHHPETGAVMTNAELNAALVKSEEIEIQNPSTGKMERTIANTDIKLGVKTFRLIQDIYFNKVSGKLEVKLLAFAPLMELNSSGGQFIGEKPLFYIYMHE